MSVSSFVPTAALSASLIAGMIACGQDPQSPELTRAVAGDEAASAAATAAAGYSVKDLGTLGGAEASATGINDHGAVVGWSRLADGRQHAFLWRAGTMRDLGTLGGSFSEAHAINNSDVVVGQAATKSTTVRAARWKNGTITGLGTLTGGASDATAINDSGVIVGWSSAGPRRIHAFVWRNGRMQDLGTLPHGQSSAALGINRSGRIVGWSDVGSGAIHAVSWKDGVIKDLGTNGHVASRATAVNTRGQIAALLGPVPDAEGEALEASFPSIFYQGGWTAIGVTDTTNDVNAINDNGTVVGSSYNPRDPSQRQRAFVAEAGAVGILPSLTAGGVHQDRAFDINSFGTIVGSSAEVPVDIQPSRAVLWRRQ